VVEPEAAVRTRGLGTDSEEAEVVVVARAGEP
jgi:hypothetical protein